MMQLIGPGLLPVTSTVQTTIQRSFESVYALFQFELDVKVKAAVSAPVTTFSSATNSSEALQRAAKDTNCFLACTPPADHPCTVTVSKCLPVCESFLSDSPTAFFIAILQRTAAHQRLRCGGRRRLVPPTAGCCKRP